MATNPDIQWSSAPTSKTRHKHFELPNHLGNVLATVSDEKMPESDGFGHFSHFAPRILSTSDYYPFGLAMEGRTFSGEGYRFGFNGMEKDYSLAGDYYDFGARIYDAEKGRWLSVDPLQRNYPYASPFNYTLNNPILLIDPDGKDTWVFDERGNFYGKIKDDLPNAVTIIASNSIYMIHNQMSDHISKQSSLDRAIDFQYFLGNSDKLGFNNKNPSEILREEKGNKNILLDPFIDIKNLATKEKKKAGVRREIGMFIGYTDRKHGNNRVIGLTGKQYTVGLETRVKTETLWRSLPKDLQNTVIGYVHFHPGPWNSKEGQGPSPSDLEYQWGPMSTTFHKYGIYNINVVVSDDAIFFYYSKYSNKSLFDYQEESPNTPQNSEGIGRGESKFLFKIEIDDIDKKEPTKDSDYNANYDG